MMKQTRRWGARPWPFRAGLVLGGVGWLNGISVPTVQAQDEPPTKAACAQAYESSQESRAAGQLRETEQRLSLCARPECPSFVQKDCARWLEEVERELPSVIIEAKGLDADAAAQITMKLDGNVVPDAFSGSEIALDPGRHEIIAESPGRPSLTRVIVVQQGVQKRTVTLDFGGVSTPVPAADVALDTGTEGSTLRPYAYVAWGVGAVGFGMFAVLGTLGRADERGLRDDCPSVTTDPARTMPGVCFKERSDERKSIYEREFVLADIGLVTGIMGAAAGTVMFVLAAADSGGNATVDESSDAALHLDVAPMRDGGYATVRGSF
jgi:hypothetical protein